MIVVNFSHPLTEAQRTQIAHAIGVEPEVRDVNAQIDREPPLGDVAAALVDAAGLTPVAWQTLPLIINPPALAPLASVVLAEIHGRAGGFPALLNIRPRANSLVTEYEVAEVINLNAIRERARQRR
jgi:hypothetical protein